MSICCVAVFRRAFLIYKADKLTVLGSCVIGDLADFFKDDLVKHLRSDGVRRALFLAHVLSVSAANKSVGIGFRVVPRMKYSFELQSAQYTAVQ